MVSAYSSLDIVAEHMRNIGEQLVPYNHPQADASLERDLYVLKTRELFIDGYWVMLHFNKADYKTHFLETLQIFGKKTPFLPFNLVVKLGRKFLGGHHLSLYEALRDKQDLRKIYCWNVMLDRQGRPIQFAPQETQLLTFEGFCYTYIQDPKLVNLY